MHPTSLPSLWGVGDFGPWAFRFLDLLEEERQSIWQMLPLTPVARHGSPYGAHSLFGGNTLLLSPEKLVEGGYLPGLPSAQPGSEDNRVDFETSLSFKAMLLQAAFKHSYDRVSREKEYSDFREKNAYWLDDYAVYCAVSKEQGTPWYEWPEGVRKRAKTALDERKSKLRPAIEETVFSQYLFQVQWSALAGYARSKGITVLGDAPYYAFHDSADIWAHRDLFKVDAEGKALFVGGVPPDYFAKTGQRWGSPVYDWSRMEATNYEWWKKRVERSLELSDLLRLDHFRGYVAYWEIPSSCETAVEGNWVSLPATFFGSVRAAFPSLPFLAEDLGVITDDVAKAREELGIPGMRVLLFAFDGSPDNSHLPPNYTPHTFVYTGTHDTNTVRGWFDDDATAQEKQALEVYLGRGVTGEGVAQDMIHAALTSAAEVSIVPMQDLLGLGTEGRMNNPATTLGNWRWRAAAEDFSEERFRLLGELTESCGRG